MEHTKSGLDGQRRGPKPRLEKLERRKDGRKKPEETQQLILKEWPHILDAISDWVCLIDLKGRVLRTNSMIEAFTGIRPADSIWQPCCRLVHGTTKRVPGCPVPEMLRTGRRATAEFKLPDKNRWLTVTVDPVRDETGNITGAVHITSDITKRKQAEETLQWEKNFAESLVETAQAIVLVLDLEGRIIRFNPYMEEISGYLLEEVKGKDWFSTFLPKRDRKRIRELFLRASSDIKTIGNVNPIVTKDGRERLVEWYDKILRDPDGNIVGLLSVGHDITRRKQTEKALLESEKLAAKGQMAARIAHELNNPLAGIKNSLLLLKDAVPTGHRHYHYLGLVSNEIDRLSHIVHQMFDFYRPAVAQAKQFSVDDAIAEVTELLEMTCREYNVAVSIKAGEAVVTLPENLLRQVLYNIIKNAVEASPPGAVVQVRPKMTGKTLTIEVADEGGGIAEDVQPHIFEPSFTTKKGLKASGLGLGLSVSRDIVEQMGGRLDFESKVGRGSTFSITIPCTEIGKESEDG